MAIDDLGRFLRKMREDAGLTQTQVQKLTGIDSPRISRFERGNRVPDPGQLVNLANAYGVDRHFVLLRAGIVELPGFESLIDEAEEAVALDKIFSEATLEERRELAKHLARIRIASPLVDAVFGRRIKDST